MVPLQFWSFRKCWVLPGSLCPGVLVPVRVPSIYGSNGISIVDMTLNYIWWWISSSEALANVVYLFIAITPRSTLTLSVRVPSMYGSNGTNIVDMALNWIWWWGSCSEALRNVECGGHARKRPRTPCAYFIWVHIRGRHYSMTTKRHSPDWLDNPTREMDDRRK